MKIVATDNYDRETVSEWVVADNISNEYFGNIMVNALNERQGDPNWFMKLVPDDYELYKFNPEG